MTSSESLKIVRDRSVQLERILDALGAEGRGLGEKYRNLDLPQSLKRDLRTIVHMRNQVMHDGKNLSDVELQQYITLTDRVIAALTINSSYRPVSNFQPTQNQEAFISTPQPLRQPYAPYEGGKFNFTDPNYLAKQQHYEREVNRIILLSPEARQPWEQATLNLIVQQCDDNVKAWEKEQKPFYGWGSKLRWAAAKISGIILLLIALDTFYGLLFIHHGIFSNLISWLLEIPILIITTLGVSIALGILKNYLNNQFLLMVSLICWIIAWLGLSLFLPGIWKILSLCFGVLAFSGLFASPYGRIMGNSRPSSGDDYLLYLRERALSQAN